MSVQGKCMRVLKCKSNLCMLVNLYTKSSYLMPKNVDLKLLRESKIGCYLMLHQRAICINFSSHHNVT